MTRGIDLESVRIEHLNSLISELSVAGPISNQMFSSIFVRAVKTLELDEVTTVRMIGVSRPTIWRWQNGESAPASLMKPVVFETLRREAMRKLRTRNPL